MAIEFSIRQFDRQPILVETLTDQTGAAMDLSPAGGVASLTFVLTKVGDPEPTVYAAGALYTNGVDGQAQYQWAAGDTNVAGLYLGYWLITDTAGKTITFPNNDYERILISPAQPAPAP